MKSARHKYLFVITSICLLLTFCSTVVLAGQKRKQQVSQLTPELAKKIVTTARSYGLPPLLVLEVMRQESSFKPKARSNKGAAGLMQMMPGTAARFGITDPTDPDQALHGGCRYLVFLIEKFLGRLDLVLASYNAGEHKVEKYGNKVPPYAETRAYVRNILLAYKRGCELSQGSLSDLPVQIRAGSNYQGIRTERVAALYQRMLSFSQ
jgi:soluble lytic murein transglycosylase-like protein